ncbi:AI-2E family transporter [Lacisediminimonas profundi]|uniref:AI-2E family transporter n=1 Tax=Lacisediminimonas profundi TaxID=2603856 RepID=UPI00124AFA9F|nr:AI-2E family transporter [Lacisediminimonas profundi]
MTLYTKTFVIAVAALCGFALYGILTPFWGPLAWGISLAFLLAPLHRRLTRKLNGRANASAGILTALVPVLLAGPLLGLGAVFARQVADVAARLQKNPPSLNTSLLEKLEENPILGSLSRWLRHNIAATTEQIEGWMVTGAEKLMQSLATKGGDFVLGALDTVIHFFLMLFLLFFLLRDGQDMLDRGVRLVPMDRERKNELLKLIAGTTRAVVFGEILTALAQGALVGIGFQIAGVPSAVLFGVLAAALALLPMGGAAIVWLPATIYLAFTSEWGWALFMLAWGTGVSVIDNVMRPLLVASQAPVSTLAVFVGVVGGISAFGMVGVIIGPVVLTVIIALLGYLDESLTRRS